MVDNATLDPEPPIIGKRYVALRDVEKAEAEVPSLKQFWWKDLKTGPFLVLYPGAHPDDVKESNEKRRPAKSPESLDSLHCAVNYEGDNNARDFVTDILRRTYGCSEVKCRLAQAFVLATGYQAEMGASHVVLIGSPASNPVTGEAMQRLAAAGLEIPERFQERGIADLKDSAKVYKPVRKVIPKPDRQEEQWTSDYGYIGRFPNPWADASSVQETGKRYLIIIAGFGSFGTQAAGAVLTVEDTMRELLTRKDKERDVIQGICEVTMPNEPQRSAESRILVHWAEHLEVCLVWAGNRSTPHILNRTDVDRCLDSFWIVTHAGTEVFRDALPPDWARSHRVGAAAYFAFGVLNAGLFVHALCWHGNAFPLLLSSTFSVLSVFQGIRLYLRSRELLAEQEDAILAGT